MRFSPQERRSSPAIETAISPVTKTVRSRPASRSRPRRGTAGVWEWEGLNPTESADTIPTSG